MRAAAGMYSYCTVKQDPVDAALELNEPHLNGDLATAERLIPADAATDGEGQCAPSCSCWRLSAAHLCSVVACLLLSSSAVVLVALWAWPNSSSLLDTAFSFLSAQPSLVLQPLSLSLLAADLPSPALGEDWKSRLDPVRVELSEGYAGLLVNTRLLTGEMHLPPLFLGLPCLMPDTPALAAQPLHITDCASHGFTEARLAFASLSEVTIVVSLYSHSDSSSGSSLQLVSEQRAVHISRERAEAETSNFRAQTVLANFSLTCVVNGTSLCPTSQAAAALHSLVRTDAHIVWLSELPANSRHTVAVSLSNGSHVTAPVFRSFSIIAQWQLFQSETQSLSATLDRMVPQRKQAPFEDAGFASSASARNASSCPAAFHEFFHSYRLWHEAAIARLRAAGSDIAAVRRVLQDPHDPVQVIAFTVNKKLSLAGLADRTVGLLGLYALSLLSRRLFLFDSAGWPDVFLLAQFSLQLNLPLVVPALSHPQLQDITAHIDHINDDGAPLRRLNETLNASISVIATNRGIVFKLLQRSDYSPLMAQLGLTQLNAAGCLYHSLLTLRQHALVSASEYAPVLSQLLDAETTAIGLQIRTALIEKWEDRNGQSLKAAAVDDLLPPLVWSYFRCAQDISDGLRSSARGAQRMVWLLVTDSQRVRTSALARYGQHQQPQRQQEAQTCPLPHLTTVMIPELLGHAASGLASLQLSMWQHSMVEQLLFSLCHRHVISHTSGFGRLPSILNMNTPLVYQMSPELADKPSANCVDERATISPNQLGWGWSGI